MSIFKINFIDRYFGPNETIEAVIRNSNKDESISGGLLKHLVNEFNIKNNYEVPTLGKLYKIPTIKK